MRERFGRLLTAMITPFDGQGAVDYKKAADLADMLVQTGTEGIVVTGTTGESPTLTHEEEFELYRAVKSAVGKKASIIAGTGSNCTRTTIHSTQVAQDIGIDGAMVVVPYYNKPSQEGMYQHFSAIAQSTKLPLIIYNIPGRTGVNMLPDTVKRLSPINNYVAIKEASGDLNQIKSIIEQAPSDFMVYSGDDALTLPVLKAGGYGIISVAAHVAGQEMSQMINAYVSGEVAAADALHEVLMPLFKVLFITANPTPVKAALSMCWKEVGVPRLPLIEATDKEKAEICSVLQQIKKI
ncbi:MAG TPA: 4-hydroxy-tetrahydrodipicolinate synthase [Candidatus Margulisbacteria bacterium]|nr:MAG: 4-hydroxy-tetrahydrodipicolinate synthase [Candidatus Margulisbacteria bacterium GWD2_39_127]HAR61832.1 4-hydroxy-tetrahydrodipicolinate synthase [Candidatus Margulisiibacteriota bacterium]